MDGSNDGASQDGVISVRNVELIVAALLALGALVVMWTNYHLGAGWAAEGPEAGYFPFRIGVIIFVSSLAVAWQGVRSRRHEAFVSKAQLKQVCVILLPLTVYVALIGTLGIYVASAVFIAAFMLAVGKFAWWKAALVGAGINLALFWIFELQFRVPLPKGPLEHAFGF